MKASPYCDRLAGCESGITGLLDFRTGQYCFNPVRRIPVLLNVKVKGFGKGEMWPAHHDLHLCHRGVFRATKSVLDELDEGAMQPGTRHPSTRREAGGADAGRCRCDRATRGRFTLRDRDKLEQIAGQSSGFAEKEYSNVFQFPIKRGR